MCSHRHASAPSLPVLGTPRSSSSYIYIYRYGYRYRYRNRTVILHICICPLPLRVRYAKVRIFKIRRVSLKSKKWVADPANRLCDAPVRFTIIFKHVYVIPISI